MCRPHNSPLVDQGSSNPQQMQWQAPGTGACPLCQYGIIHVVCKRDTAYTCCRFCFSNPLPVSSLAGYKLQSAAILLCFTASNQSTT